MGAKTRDANMQRLVRDPSDGRVNEAAAETQKRRRTQLGTPPFFCLAASYCKPKLLQLAFAVIGANRFKVLSYGLAMTQR